MGLQPAHNSFCCTQSPIVVHHCINYAVRTLCDQAPFHGYAGEGVENSVAQPPWRQYIICISRVGATHSCSLAGPLAHNIHCVRLQTLSFFYLRVLREHAPPVGGRAKHPCITHYCRQWRPLDCGAMKLSKSSRST